ncbi:hypothetical protein AXW67_20010 [Bradyrhizobium neotropicale]|uniref:Uncharacterized protein n=1 Tax=Bradyrhizobium neotropicale TaxID=1497615 RepID=A0A176Z0F2_9BRAD|nr:hypothetical protein AXW67_20010 [Bradyrhizobium neotropicale]
MFECRQKRQQKSYARFLFRPVPARLPVTRTSADFPLAAGEKIKSLEQTQQRRQRMLLRADRLAIIPDCSAESLSSFVEQAVATGAKIITDIGGVRRSHRAQE